MIDFNAVYNVFIDSLSFNDIPQQFKTELILSIPTGQDRIAAGAAQMVESWRNDWAKDYKNIEKSNLIDDVADKRVRIEQKETEAPEEIHIQRLLEDIIPGFKDGTYQQALDERDMYVVTQMADFLGRIGKPVPHAVTTFFNERLSVPPTKHT
ncbi:MAG TPA: hypothetical protein VMR81_01040 [Patescibacteria group bacterium]|nr:hypothetical protein [Patescibacteria group bacterium]